MRLKSADDDRASLREGLKALRETVTAQQDTQASEITQLKSQCDDLMRTSADLNAELTLTKSEHSSALNDIRTKFQTTLSRIADAQHAFDKAIKELTDLCKDFKIYTDQGSGVATGSKAASGKDRTAT